MGIIGMKSVLRTDPAGHFPECFTTTARPYLRFLPQAVDPYFCAIYETIQRLPQAPGAHALIAQLLRFGVTFVGVVVYEGTRQGSSWLNPAEPHLLVAQATSGAAAIPLYFSVIQARREREQDFESTPPKPTPQDAWATLISVTLGYALPCWYASQISWRGNALLLVLPYPIYILAMRILLRSSLAPLLKDASYKIPVLMQASLGFTVSAIGQLKLLGSHIPIHEILRPRVGVDFTGDLHAMLLADLAITATGLASHVVLHSYSNRSVLTKAVLLASMAAGSLVVGPGGAISVVWAYAELSNMNKADTDTSKSKAKHSEQQPLLQAQTRSS
ncbi:hypothetical protein LTR64_003750 [Lithohypha guttulata]|uniref:uncharacterized protein n=1 Tax=Lithohypha guttulata TaxID=1690604 RepID=UPI002DE032EF|nr:hypothetical protein LTR51_000030 [Lithohypha guttulata]